MNIGKYCDLPRGLLAWIWKCQNSASSFPRASVCRALKCVVKHLARNDGRCFWLMDPLSISTSVVALIGAVVNTSITVTKFAQSVRDARQELASTSRELNDLRTVLEFMQYDYNSETVLVQLPAVSSMAVQIQSVLENCNKIIGDLDQLVTKYDSKRMQWVLFGKDKVIALNAQLAAHIKTLQLGVNVSSPYDFSRFSFMLAKVDEYLCRMLTQAMKK